jgi:lipopolysaccharide transport system permease protein
MWNRKPALFEYRELLYFFILRDIKAKYKQTILGVAWAFIQPVIFITIFTVVFSYFARLPSDGIPYALFSYCALLPWQFFSNVLIRGTSSLLIHQGLVQKVYFPREIIVLSVIASATIDFVLGGFVFAGLLWFYGVSVTSQWIFIAPVFCIQLCFSIGLVLLLSPINVFYRDVGLLLPFVIQVWMYATPIIYPLSVVPERFRVLYSFNPMVGIIEAYRQLIIHGKAPEPVSLLLSFCLGVAILGVGIYYFKSREDRLADVL